MPKIHDIAVTSEMQAALSEWLNGMPDDAAGALRDFLPGGFRNPRMIRERLKGMIQGQASLPDFFPDARAIHPHDRPAVIARRGRVRGLVVGFSSGRAALHQEAAQRIASPSPLPAHPRGFCMDECSGPPCHPDAPPYYSTARFRLLHPKTALRIFVWSRQLVDGCQRGDAPHGILEAAAGATCGRPSIILKS